MQSEIPLSLRSKQAAKTLGISVRYLSQLTHDGHISCVRLGSGSRKTVLYPMDVLREFLASRVACIGHSRKVVN